MLPLHPCYGFVRWLTRIKMKDVLKLSIMKTLELCPKEAILYQTSQYYRQCLNKIPFVKYTLVLYFSFHFFNIIFWQVYR